MKSKAGVIRSFVIPVPRAKLAKYQKTSKRVAQLWMEHGALTYIEAVGYNLERGKRTSFPRSLKLKKGEVVILGWSAFKNQAHFNRVIHKVLADPRLAAIHGGEHPFDGKRMYWGGFKPFFQAYQ